MPKGDKSNHPNGHTKCSVAEKEHRIEQCIAWFMDNPNLRTVDFERWCNMQWGITRNQALHYKKEAYKKLNEGMLEQRTADLRLAIASLKKQYVAAEKDEDYKLAFQIQTEINKLQGLHTIKIEQKVEGEKPLFQIKPVPYKGLDEIDE